MSFVQKRNDNGEIVRYKATLVAQGFSQRPDIDFEDRFQTELNGYADVGYLSDPHNGKSQTGYLFTSDGTAISWRSVKQIISATSSNHAEILALHETSCECVWLRSVIQHIQKTCGLSSRKMTSTIIYEDNVACIAQLKYGYIREIEQSIFYQNSFLLMIFKGIVI
uniref:Retrovirus-related Pol polyprotein from transposon TNT 1-94 n=1 Tax=Cajanus cajan TaxID=3821 RepID=A0A151RT73_CAJCA|nr:Retrovirus-related Pol polyprotein from transposon TNT 1-94 [Cajanus cajan]